MLVPSNGQTRPLSVLTGSVGYLVPSGNLKSTQAYPRVVGRKLSTSVVRTIFFQSGSPISAIAVGYALERS